MRQPPQTFTQLAEAPTQVLPAVTPAPAATAPAPRWTPTPDRGLLARLQTRHPDAPSGPVARISPTHVIDRSMTWAARTTAAKQSAARRGVKKNGNLKKLLVTTIVMATIGTLASGTFATFTAQGTNASNTFSTGTLVLGDTPTAYAQVSSLISSGTSLATIPIYRLAAPIPSGTTVVISDNATPTPHTQSLTTAATALPGATSLSIASAPNAAQNYAATTATVSYPVYYAKVLTTAAITNGSNITSIAVAAIQNQIPSGTTLTISNGTASQTINLSASAASGATALTTTSTVATANYPIGSMVFWSASGLGITTTASVSGTVTAIPVSALAQAIPANAIVLLNNPSISAPTFQSLTVTAAGAALGATSIPVTSTALNNTYPAGSLVSYDYSSGSTCYSTSVTAGSFNNSNSNGGCDALMFSSYGRPQASGEYAYTADISITNKGTLPASSLTVYLNNCATTNNTAETYNGTGDLCGKLEVFLQEWGDASHTSGLAVSCRFGQATGNLCNNPMTDGTAPILNTFNGSASPLSLSGALAPGATRYFTIGLRLPTAADNTFQGRTATFDFVWTLSQ